MTALLQRALVACATSLPQDVAPDKYRILPDHGNLAKATRRLTAVLNAMSKPSDSMAAFSLAGQWKQKGKTGAVYELPGKCFLTVKVFESSQVARWFIQDKTRRAAKSITLDGCDDCWIDNYLKVTPIRKEYSSVSYRLRKRTLTFYIVLLHKTNSAEALKAGLQAVADIGATLAHVERKR